MVDDQATLGTFAGSDSDDEDGDPGSDPGEGGTVSSEGGTGDDGSGDAIEPGADGGPPTGDPVCPWCLAPAEAFVDRGLTGRACGRCSAALPTGADWFHERDVVARRPMYDVDGTAE